MAGTISTPHQELRGQGGQRWDQGELRYKQAETIRIKMSQDVSKLPVITNCHHEPSFSEALQKIVAIRGLFNIPIQGGEVTSMLFNQLK